MSETGEITQAVGRLERAVDEAYSRYAGAGEEKRIAGIAKALEDALGGEPRALHAELLDRIADQFRSSEPVGHTQRKQADPAAVTTMPGDRPDPGMAAECLALRAEVERLQREQRSATESFSEPPAGIIEAVLGSEHDGGTIDELPGGASLASVVRLLVNFTADLGQAFLDTGTQGGGKTQREDRVRTTLRGEVLAKLPAGSVAALLDEIKQAVGRNLEAVPMACIDGARQMLKELDPLVLEDRARDKLPKLAMFRAAELWSVFQRRHAELSGQEDIYRAYFDGPLRKHQFRLRGAKS